MLWEQDTLDAKPLLLLLITESMTIKEVAYSLGYNDHSYFNRIFRKTCGKTPLEYREEMKGMMGNSIN